jgi:hypothetical protein
MSNQMKKPLSALLAIFFLALGFAIVHTASADSEIEFDRIVVDIKEQDVDLDGDGKKKPEAAYFVINDAGTMSFDPYKNFNFRVNWDNATIQPTEDGQILVEARGLDDETGQTYFMSFEFDPRQASTGQGGGSGDFILVDIVGASAVQLQATVQFYIN